MSKQIKGVVIKPDCTYDEVTLNDLPDYQKAVDGFIESVKLYNYDGEEVACAYVDEDGLNKRLSLNPLGSAISFLFGNTPYLMGNVLIVGKGDAEGYDTDIPEFLFKLTENICGHSIKESNV
jgi:hypothetical protein